MTKQILLVEDDPKAAELIESQLSAHGYEVGVAVTGRQGLESIAKEPPDLVLLDLKLPDIDGIEVCKQMREKSLVPIILVTATEDTQAKVSALGAGADDYVTKPIHIEELVARIEAVLRRSALPGAMPDTLEIGGIRIDLDRREVFRDGVSLRLTRTECDVLTEMIKHPNKVRTYDQLLRAVWGPGYQDVRAIHVHVCHLRRKIEGPNSRSRVIVSIPGVGYQLRTDEIAVSDVKQKVDQKNRVRLTALKTATPTEKA